VESSHFVNDKPLNLLFEVDASPLVGFGHAGRCIRLAEKIAADRDDVRFIFRGDLKGGARDRISRSLPGVQILAAGTTATTDVSVLDTMGDPEEPDDWNEARLSMLSRSSKAVVFLSSGRTPPATSTYENVTIVGYQPGSTGLETPGIEWSLAYGPYDKVSNDQSARIADRVVIALGGAERLDIANIIMEAISAMPAIRDVVYLGSPVGTVMPDANLLSDGQKLEIVRNVPDVEPLIQSADALIISYGNMMFEALALCTPCCVVGIKVFQLEYARELDKQGLAVTVDERGMNRTSVLQAMERLENCKPSLLKNCAATFTSSGYRNLADIISRELDNLCPEKS
jgi:spore coat polysaccharide biosynthesis predicted glycosyltransferase SpsG